jgi:hypothetical protein
MLRTTVAELRLRSLSVLSSWGCSASCFLMCGLRLKSLVLVCSVEVEVRGLWSEASPGQKSTRLKNNK